MSVAAFLWLAGAALALGGSTFLRRAGAVPAPLRAWEQTMRLAICGAVAIALLAGVALLFDDAARIAGHPLVIGAHEWHTLLTRTRLGQTWIAREALLVLVFVAACVDFRRSSRGLATSLLAAAFLAIGAWAGHGGGTEPLAVNVPLHALHALAAGVWLGGLPLWAALVARVDDSDAARGYLARAITRFSTAATLMMVVLVASGTWIATQQFGRWAAVFGTRSGALLGAKLALLALALSLAFRLRRRYLAALAVPHASALRRAALRLVLVETGAAVAVFAIGLTLARSTPGAHLDIVWPWPFRFAPVAAWTVAAARWQIVGGIALALVALPAFVWRHRRIGLAAFTAGASLAAYGLAIGAYPETYRKPDLAYTAHWIRHGAEIFTKHCATCHGAGGRGDGIAKLPAGILAADLSEHTALHTAGDMFWWITHGTPTGNMPAFGPQIDDEARWSLIAFLRGFADGHRGRVLAPTIVPGQPWLGAPNFQFETSGDDSGELKDYRDVQPVVIVLASLPASRDRLRAIAAEQARWQRLGARLFTLLSAGSCRDLGADAGALGCVTRGREDATFAWRLLARTLGEPGSRHTLAPDVAHAEFLVDRYGFLRARWIPSQEQPGWTDVNALERELTRLAAEPRILESPDEHVH
ncbi:MAG: c-type cytochrome [Gammaproteobacteria bacterium]|nr:c-type cytochrome [Gammaproteobacteria bacterium]